MNVIASVRIRSTKEKVWSAISNIKQCDSYINGIVGLKVIDDPTDTMIGFKWEETRVFFGKEATEIMWITDCETEKFYKTRAESHGTVYETTVSIKEIENAIELSMQFSGKPVTFIARLMLFLTGFMMKSSMKKALLVDLKDIKRYVER